METRKLIDSATSALRPAAPLLPLDTNTEDTPDVCPPSVPTCGPEPGASDPSGDLAAALPPRAAPAM